MEGATRTIALSLGAVALLAAGTALVLSGGSEPATTAGSAGNPPPPAVEPQAKPEQPLAEPAPKPDRAKPKPERPAEPREAVLRKHGNPIVWVRAGERAQIHASPGGRVVETVGPRTEFGSRTVFAVFETSGEWAGVPTPYTGNDALGWVKLDPRRMNAGNTTREIVVDLSEFRAQLLIDDEPVRTFTVAIGAPGTDTPTGRFAVTDTFRGGLNAAYGCCAVALTAEQPSLPSGWLGGNRIAFHGTSGPVGAPISSGCVRAADRDVNALVERVPPGAPVLVHE